MKTIYSLLLISILADKAFNAELDRLARYIWKEHGARLMLLPVQPEIVFKKE